MIYDTWCWARAGDNSTMTSEMSSKYFKMYLDMTRTQGYQREKNDKNVKK